MLRLKLNIAFATNIPGKILHIQNVSKWSFCERMSFTRRFLIDFPPSLLSTMIKTQKGEIIQSGIYDWYTN